MSLTEGKTKSNMKDTSKPSGRPNGPPPMGRQQSFIDPNIIREAVFCCRCDPAWHTHYSEEAKMAIANLHREMDKLFFSYSEGELEEKK